MLLSSQLAAAAIFSSGCGPQRVDLDKYRNATNNHSPREVISKDDKVLYQYNLDDDKHPDVITYFKRISAESNRSDQPRKKLTKREFDLDSNGTIDLVKKYNDDEQLVVELEDTDLNGQIDARRKFDDGRLVTQQNLAEGTDQKQVVSTQYYRGEKLIRIERDTDRDGDVDVWEYYHDGKLTRLGRDTNGDQEADQWTKR